MAQPPTWPPPQDTTEQVSALSSIRKTPSVLTGAIIRIVQTRFLTGKSYVDPSLAMPVWNEDAKRTQIGIASSSEFLPQLVASMPSILVVRLGYNTDEMTLSNKQMMMSRGLAGRLGPQFMLGIKGGHELIIHGATPEETSKLMDDLFFWFLENAPVIREDLRLEGIMPTDATHVRKDTQRAGTPWVASVKLTWMYKHNWTLTEKTPILTHADRATTV